MTSTPRVTVESWNPVGIWAYNLPVTTCDICREKITTCCPDCSSQKTVDVSVKCQVSKGKCGHGFHEHCITKWLSSNSAGICPTCRTPWNLQTKNMENDEDWKLMYGASMKKSQK